MVIEVYLTPQEFTSEDLKDKIAVVIDVLRASTTITTALYHGCKQIIPVAEVEAAMNLAANMPRDTRLLGGEREGKKIPGFDLGNSPTEYTPELVSNKTLIFTTTNGTKLLSKTPKALKTLVASLVNIEQICQHVIAHPETDLGILCAGKLNRFSLEDAVCAGLLVTLLGRHFGESLKLTDAARAAELLYQKYTDNFLEMLQQSQHGKYLIEIGMGNDLEVCARVNSIPIVPCFKEGIITPI
ncbi:MAG: 2-phosphosulfolactate phosphatase [candidate division KSB1 bacterium]|nr:2-phosphosulfolactate phosphatase [candidate division KSB1 bacterium]